REAPIPVLELQRRTIILGGAANPARNIVALGARAVQVGIVGDDPEGAQIFDLCAEVGIDASAIIRSTTRPTTRKTRILADDAPRLPQHVARLDRLDRSPLPAADEARIVEQLSERIPHADAVICSDYQLGLLSEHIVAAVRQLCQRHNTLFSVDAQGNSQRYTAADLFRCNNVEAAAALGMPLHTEADYRRGLQLLRDRLHARLVIVTRGPHGLSLLGDNCPFTTIPARQHSEVYDTTGAGDTFIAVATLALSIGLDPLSVAQLANAAAALVVRRFGNAVATPDELRAILHP
ncbi:ribokinase, partial [Candidatus Gracilibacteria bacterium]|nr:ribokinase [Candidatus Gracilibacteria bacterium]